MKTDDVYEFFGSVMNASKEIGVTRSAFYKWMDRGYIPLKQQKYIELITKGKLIAGKKKENEICENDAHVIYLPRFRYYDKKRGMCDVESLCFRENKPPKIVYVSNVHHHEKFAVFTTENLMQAIDVLDCKGKQVYEGDIFLLKKGGKFTFSDIGMINKINRLGKFTIIGNVFENN